MRYMGKTLYDRIVNGSFIIMAGLTFLCLYKVLTWLSCLLAVLFAVLVILHIRDYGRENPKRKNIFVITLFTLINFLLANAVVFISNFVYPY